MASFNPPTQFQIGDWVGYPASPAISTPKNGRCWPNRQFHGGLKGSGQPFYSGSTGNHTSSHTLFQNGPLKRQAGIKECKRMADAGSITNFIVGWKVEASLLCGGSWVALEPKWRNAKKWFAHLPWACLHMAQGRAPFQRLCPHPRHLWSMINGCG